MILLKFVFIQSFPQTLHDFLLTKLHQHGFTTAFLTQLFLENAIHVDQQSPSTFASILKHSHLITVEVPKWPAPLQPHQVSILHIDADLIVVNKPAGITTHNDHHHFQNTVTTQMKEYLNFPSVQFKPGIVHRLDKLTSGLLILARHHIAAAKLKTMFARHQIKRTYLALAKGLIKSSHFHVNAPLVKSPFHRKIKVAGIGKPAESVFIVKHLFANHTLLNCQLKTGRTHQIRVHLAYLNHPIVNDPLYQQKAQSTSANFIYLHATSLVFFHPFYKTIKLTFHQALPDYFLTFMVNNI